MPKIKCVHCGREWEYTGISKKNVTCPDCQKKTPVNPEKKPEEKV